MKPWKLFSTSIRVSIEYSCAAPLARWGVKLFQIIHFYRGRFDSDFDSGSKPGHVTSPLTARPSHTQGDTGGGLKQISANEVSARLLLSRVSAACEWPISTLPPLMVEHRSDGCSIRQEWGQNSGQLVPTDGRIDVMHNITSKLRDGTFLQAVDGFHQHRMLENANKKKSYKSRIIRHWWSKLWRLLANTATAEQQHVYWLFHLNSGYLPKLPTTLGQTLLSFFLSAPSLYFLSLLSLCHRSLTFPQRQNGWIDLQHQEEKENQK